MAQHEFKIKFHTYCLDLIQQKIKELDKAIGDAQESAQSESKSTAGDKHETAKAMAHLEIEKLLIAKNNLVLQEKVLNDINPSQQQTRIVKGTLIETSIGKFYIAIGLGKVNFMNESITVISEQAPLAKAFLGFHDSQQISFNNLDYQLIAIA